jgi:NTF2 fold immunity protein of polymorphic toxin system component
MSEDPSPEAIVSAFIQAMNRWELGAWDASRRARDTPDPASYWPEIKASFDLVFAEFCTPRDRPHGRNASFLHPPEYDPNVEKIIRSELAGDKAYVDTQREAPLGGGVLRYTLHQRNGRWLIDSVKRMCGDKWERAIL